MGTTQNRRGTGPADEFSTLLNAEIRAELGRRQISLRQLEELTEISKSRLSEAVNKNRAPLNTNELGKIANALGVSTSILLRRAEQALREEESKNGGGVDSKEFPPTTFLADHALNSSKTSPPTNWTSGDSRF